jgi:WD40 repeat protein
MHRNLTISFFAVSLFFCNIPLFSQNIETVVQTGHYSEVTSVAYSYDGKFIATGSRDKAIKLWRSSDGKEVRSLIGSPSGISKITFNKPGTLLLSVNFEGELDVWDLKTGNILRKLTLTDDKFTCAAFHPDGKEIITGSENSFISEWDLQSGAKIREIKAVPADLITDSRFDYAKTKTIAYSNDGKYIVAGTGDKTAIVWDAISGKEIRKYKKTKYTCTTCCAEAVISSDNNYVISAYSDSVKVFELSSGRLVKEFNSKKTSLSSLTISNDGRYVAAIEFGRVQIWDFKTGKVLLDAGDESKDILSVSFSPDGKQIVTGNEKRMADIWSVPGGKKTITLKGYLNQINERLLDNSYMYWAALVNETKLSPDGRYIAVGRTGNNAKLIDFKTGRIYKTLTGHQSMVLSLNFSNDGKYIATGGLDGKAILWDVETGSQLQVFRYRDTSLAVFSLDISPDNQYLATADWAGYVVIWDMASGKVIKSFSPHGGSASYHVKFLQNGIYIISAGLDQKLKLIEIDTGDEVRTFTGHTDLVTSVNLNPYSDKIITSGRDRTIRVWDFLSGLQMLKINAHTGGAYSAKFDQKGKYIISGGDDNLVKLWDASTGKLISEFSGHRGCVGDVNMTEDQKYIISGSRDGSIRTWSVDKKRELVSMLFLNENDLFIKNPQGYFDASEGAFKSISFVNGTDLYAIDQFFNEFYRPGIYADAVFRSDSVSYRENVRKSIENFPPPKLELIAPAEEGMVSETDQVTLMVKVTNSGGGVKELKVLQNGKRQAIDDSELRRMKKDGQYVMKTFDLSLVPGENEISVSAFSDGEIESTPVSFKINYKGMVQTSNCYVLSIGINKYENENLTLNFAKPDAQAFTELLDAKAKRLFKKVITYSLLDKDATKANILGTLDEIAKVINKDDVFVFFYAGHGSTVDNTFYFIPTESTGLYQKDKLEKAIPVKVLQDKFKQIKALKQVVFIDACHSGSSVELLASRGAEEEKALAQLSRSSGIHVMASSESEQQSAEIKSLEHGVFTYILLQALRGNADGAPKDSKITVYELKSYIDDQVPEISYKLIRHKQFPSTFSIGHDFPLVME